MANIFPRWTNKIPQAVGAGSVLLVCGVVGAIWYWFSPWFLNVGYQPEQPIPYSHKLHAGELGIDCRYCHTTVEDANYAALPPTATCMNCHANIRKDSVKLKPLRKSEKSGEPVAWVKVHQLPDYAYFSHTAHVNAGVGCVSCHGRVDTMEVVEMVKPLSMSWCLDCHRNPEPNLRPQSEVTNMNWDRKKFDPAKHKNRAGNEVQPPVHCSGCHR